MGANVAFTPQVELDRRDFLVRSAAVGGAMVLGFYVPPANARTVPIEDQPWYRDAMVPELNAWLTIAPDDTVTIRVAQTEMGTGVLTSCPMMVAEETPVRLAQSAGGVCLAAPQLRRARARVDPAGAWRRRSVDPRRRRRAGD